jgi:ATP-binding cassette subfamily B protein
MERLAAISQRRNLAEIRVGKLDSESEALIQEAMERLSTVRSLDRILVFDRGEIVEQGTHAALTARTGGIYRSLFERQATEFAHILAAEWSRSTLRRSK